MSAKPPERLMIEAVRTFCARTRRDFRSMSHGWLLQVLDPDRSHLIFGYDLGLNRSAAQQVANDKSATSDILAAANIPVIEHVLFHAPHMRPYVPESGNWAAILALFEQWGEDVVCKSHTGTGGARVFRARTRLELEECVQLLFGGGRALTLSPFVDFANECRVVVLDGAAELVYRKQRPVVVGDGVSTLAELIGRGSGLEAPREEAAGAKLDPDRVPERGETVLIEWRHNLAHGAAPVPVPEEEARPLVELAVAAAGALGLRFASVDIAEADEARVLEINAGVMMESFAASDPSNRERALAIYFKALARALEA